MNALHFANFLFRLAHCRPLAATADGKCEEFIGTLKKLKSQHNPAACRLTTFMEIDSPSIKMNISNTLRGCAFGVKICTTVCDDFFGRVPEESGLPLNCEAITETKKNKDQTE